VISFEGDKIKELRQYFDMMTLLKHIGFGEKPGQASEGAG
jgi:hypothetical protein